MTAPFISLDDLSDALGEDVTTSDLAVIAIDSACQVIRDELGNTINLVEDEDITLDGRGRFRLILREPPVREVTSVEIDGTAVATDDYVLEDGAVLKGMFLRRISDVWPIGLGNIALTYSHGWDIAEGSEADFERVPSSIRRVALSLARRIYINSGSGGGGATTQLRLGSAAESFDAASAVALATSDLLEDELRTLNPYRTYAFG